ncbi:unnamed protein product [Effrenium voratum]|nr:unnamed protein product [Effrenium voratum]
MAGRSRLRVLLRDFGCPAEADAATLAAGFRRLAKERHPDLAVPLGKSRQTANAEFAELRKRFEEAKELLEKQKEMEAMVDWKISVTDPGWEVKKPSTDALAAMQSHWLGGDAVGKNFLDWVLDSEESRQAVRAAALALDIESSFSTHKVAVVLRLRGEQVQALLFVSRAFWGSRQLAIALLQGVETAQPSVPVQVPRQLVERSRAPTITVEEASERGVSDSGSLSFVSIALIGLDFPATRLHGTWQDWSCKGMRSSLGFCQVPC